jgi:hypothetical protein
MMAMSNKLPPESLCRIALPCAAATISGRGAIATGRRDPAGRPIEMLWQSSETKLLRKWAEFDGLPNKVAMIHGRSIVSFIIRYKEIENL